jgi:hypothetical protein
MSDERDQGKSPPHDAQAPRAALTGPVEHWCQRPGCKKWGGWGYERGRGETDWFCYEHRPESRQDAAR